MKTKLLDPHLFEVVRVKEISVDLPGPTGMGATVREFSDPSILVQCVQEALAKHPNWIRFQVLVENDRVRDRVQSAA